MSKASIHNYKIAVIDSKNYNIFTLNSSSSLFTLVDWGDLWILSVRNTKEINPHSNGNSVIKSNGIPIPRTNSNAIFVLTFRQIFNLFAWILSIATMATVIFINYPLQQSDANYTWLEYGLYDALSRVTWAIAVCYVIFACVHNHGGVVNWFLGHPLWQPISRLSYSIYLTHLITITAVMAPVKTSLYFSEFTAVSVFFFFCQYWNMQFVQGFFLSYFAVSHIHWKLFVDSICFNNSNVSVWIANNHNREIDIWAKK